MMHRYKVTQEISTPWWKKALRFLRLYPKLKTFEIVFGGDYYEVGEILFGGKESVKVIEK